MSQNNRIPFLDLITPHSELKDELVTVFEAALASATFIGGPMVEAFEHEFAEYCGLDHCVGVGSGTDALRFALIAAGITSGDVVVTVPNTFIATTEAITQSGARPVFVDVDAQTLNMDVEKLRDYLENHCQRDPTTKALLDRRLRRPVTTIVPVHLYGQPADMDTIMELAARYDLIVIEDACQAHGAEYYSEKDHRWKKAGAMGHAAAFSFYPGKNLGACGEAGAITTSDSKLAQRVRMLRDHGQAQKYYHQVEGYNGRLDAMQAGVLRVKLRRLAEWNQQRRMSAGRYGALFASCADRVRLPFEPKWAKPVYHLYVVRVSDRGSVQQHLAEAGISTGIHYPVPLHLQLAYQGLGYKPGDFPVTEQATSEIISLPMFPGLQHSQQRRVADVLLTRVLSRASHLAGAQTAGASR